MFQMLKQSDQEREEQLIQQMKDILEAAMVPIVQPWMAENQLNYSMLHSISKNNIHEHPTKPPMNIREYP